MVVPVGDAQTPLGATNMHQCIAAPLMFMPSAICVDAAFWHAGLTQAIRTMACLVHECTHCHVASLSGIGRLLRAGIEGTGQAPPIMASERQSRTCLVDCVQVHSKPHVGVLSTGDELVEPSTERLEAGKIRDANRSMLLSAAESAGARVTDFGIAPDTEEAVEAAFAAILDSRVDVLLTTGVHWACAGQAGL